MKYLYEHIVSHTCCFIFTEIPLLWFDKSKERRLLRRGQVMWPKQCWWSCDHSDLYKSFPLENKDPWWQLGKERGSKKKKKPFPLCNTVCVCVSVSLPLCRSTCQHKARCRAAFVKCVCTYCCHGLFLKAPGDLSSYLGHLSTISKDKKA